VTVVRDTEPIYRNPRDYDLEHEGDDEDVAFYLRLATRLRPRRILELACGSGRVSIPLATLGAEHGFDVVGLELADEMLDEARRKREALDPPARDRLSFVRGDMRTWESDGDFDLVISPCSSLSHLLTLDDQLATWRRAYAHLAPGGRFVADLAMPSFASFGDSSQTPQRLLVEIDLDRTEPGGSTRLLRYKTTRYLPHEQRAEIRFLYDRLDPVHARDRYVSDFDSHVYFPRELQLLFLHTGFAVETTWGSYSDRPLRASSRVMLMVGRKGEERS
jgi:SAM-dependent methyltransferase